MSSTLSPIQSELLRRADTIMDAIGNVVTKSSDFATEQLPDIAQQFIMYSRAQYTLYIVLSLVILVLTAIAASIAVKRDLMIITPVIALPGFISLFIFSINIPPFLMVWFAPKVFLLTQLISLVK